jgi:hypothetical protein
VILGAKKNKTRVNFINSAFKYHIRPHETKQLACTGA